MSRVGKQPIIVPLGVKVEIKGSHISVNGSKGSLSMDLPRLTSVSLHNSHVNVSRIAETGEARAMHGLARALLNNLIEGVSKGFQKRLEIQGVGFKASVQGTNVNLALGFSHPILYPIPSGVRVTVEENTKLTIEGANKVDVGRVAAEIRSFYPPEPYKGKGVRYANEKVVRKEGKTVQ